MSNVSRTKNVLKNTTVSLICNLASILASFGCRTVFTFTLGSEYLGVNGLFTNILTILSFAELGIGTAIVYRLYAPIANKDINKINLYMKLYKKIYFVIALLVTVIGIAIIPLLKYIVKSPEISEDIRLLYILYLTQTTISYVFTYKKSIITADQKEYIVSTITQVLNILMNIFQCIFLIVTHNFIMYLCMYIIFGLLINISCSVYADRKYPYLNKNVEETLGKEEVNGLKKDVKGLLLTKIAATTFNGTDNIFISTFIGLNYVGILSNYTLILTTINGFMNKVFGSITASIGNLVVTDKNDKTEEVLKKIYFVNATIYCYVCTGMIVLIKEFVTTIWLNSEYFLSDFVIVLAITELLLRSLHYPLHTTQLAMGLFSQYRIVYLFAALLNILLDFLLINVLGIAGLFVATIICRGLIFVTDIYVVYHIGLKKRVINYYKLPVKWLFTTAACVVISKMLTAHISFSGMAGFFIKILLVTILYGVLFYILNSKTDEFSYFTNLIKKIIRKKV